MGKRSFIIRRSIQSVATFFVIITLIFFMFRLIPADPTSMLIHSQISHEAKQQIMADWGFDKPLYLQYFKYVGNLLRGDFGISFYYRKPVFQVLYGTMFNTFILVGLAITIAFLGAVLLGAYLGWKRGKKIEKIGVLMALFYQAMPLYWIGILALMIFSYWLKIFPTGGIRMVGLETTSLLQKYLSLDFLRHLGLPLLCASLYYMANPLLIMRTSMLEVRGEDFLEMSLAKGFDERTIIKHCARNALLPIVSHAAIMSGHIFGGQVLLETVFTWPGMGRELVKAVIALDYPVAQAVFFLMAVAVVAMNFVADLLYGYLDPRIVYK